MSRHYGFRIYLVQAFPNRAAGNAALTAEAGSNVHRRIVDLLTSLNGAGTQFRNPRPPRAGEPPGAVVTTTFGVPREVRNDFVHIELEMGETGLHRRAVRLGRPSRSLDGWSAEMGFRLALLFPRTADNRFMVVAETYRGRDALKRFISVLTKADLDRKKSHVESMASLAPDQRTSHERLLFQAEQAPDEAYLDEILGDAKKATAVFKSTAPSSRGRREVITRKLTIELREPGAVQQIGRDLGRRWFGQQRADHPRTRAEGLSDLAVELEANNLMEAGESERYDEAVIAVVDGEGERTNIASDTLRDVFTYPVADNQSNDWYFYDRVAPRVRSVARESSLDIARIDPSEVNEWLAAST